MKTWQIIVIVLGVWGVMYVATRAVSHESDFTEREHLRNVCTNARIEFFGKCLESSQADAQRPVCEVMWAQLRGHIFDGDPRLRISDEVDCSRIVK